MTSTAEIQKDVEELQKLVDEATRSRVKDLLNLEIRRLQTELLQRSDQNASDSSQQASVQTASATSFAPQVYKELIKSYAWDQSDKFMKLYVTLKGVQSLDKSAICCQFTQQSVKMEVKGLDGKNSELYITRLAEPIDPDASYHKLKADMVLLMLKKQQTGKTWIYVTEQEKKSKEVKKRPQSKEQDENPTSSLMGMLKNMYEEGDDEMKRTISKAFFDSQSKKSGDLGV